MWQNGKKFSCVFFFFRFSWTQWTIIIMYERISYLFILLRFRFPFARQRVSSACFYFLFATFFHSLLRCHFFCCCCRCFIHFSTVLFVLCVAVIFPMCWIRTKTRIIFHCWHCRRIFTISNIKHKQTPSHSLSLSLPLGTQCKCIIINRTSQHSHVSLCAWAMCELMHFSDRYANGRMLLSASMEDFHQSHAICGWALSRLYQYVTKLANNRWLLAVTHFYDYHCRNYRRKQK